MMLRDRRRRVLGVPVGRKRRHSMPGLGWAGAGVAVGAATLPLAARASRAVSHGREVAGQAQNAIGAAKNIQNAVSSHSSTLGKFGAVVSEVRKMGSGGGGADKPRLSHLIEEHTDIAAPCSVVYNQWTQLEMFPTIVKGAESVDQNEDDRAEWTSKIGPVRRTWQARITHQVPDELIAWESEGGPQHTGVVTFHKLDDQLTRVLIQMQYKPSGPLETVGNTLRIQRRRVRRDLRMFKHFLELSGEETGEWRGQIDGSGSGSERQPSRRTRSGEAASGRRSPRPSASRRPTASRSGSGNGRSAGNRTSGGRNASPNGRSTSRSSSSVGRSSTNSGGSGSNGRTSSASSRGQSRSRASAGTRKARS